MGPAFWIWVNLACVLVNLGGILFSALYLRKWMWFNFWFNYFALLLTVGNVISNSLLLVYIVYGER